MSGYYWDDKFFEYREDFEKMRTLMNDRLDKVVAKEREYAIYRFGLEGQKEHSLKETAEHFAITPARVRSLDCSIMRMMKIRMPIDRPHLKGFFES